MLGDREIQIIRDSQSKSIRHKSLIDEQLDLIYEKQWFNIWVPTIYEGQALNLVDGLELLKELAYWDGGLSWTVTLCSGANMFAGFIQPKLAQKVFQDKKVCLGGSGMSAGKAIWDGERYVLTGFWKYATGAPHLTYFTLNAFVYDGDVQRLDGNEEPTVYSFLVHRDHVLIHYDWNTFGLETTASHSFSLENISVDKEFAFELMPEKRIVDSPLFRIPFMTFAELTLVVNYLGMYERFMDLVEKYFFEKSKDSAWAQKYSKERFRTIMSYQEQLKIDQELIGRLATQIWVEVQSTESLFSENLLNDIAEETRHIVKCIRENVVRVYPLVGISAAQQDNELNIVFRNLFTATQHSLLNV